MTTEYITLDVWDAENVRVKAKQREINSRFLEVQFIDKNEPLDLEDKQVFFLAKRPDGDIIFDRCEIINKETGKINLALTSQISAVAGIIKDCEFDIISQDLSKLKVKGLILEIEKCTDFDSETESTSEFTALEEAMAGYERASDAIDAHIADKDNPHEVTATQIGAAESNHTHSQYLTAETDPTVPSWAKAATKPTYSYSEISNTPTIPTTLTDLGGTLPISQGGTNATTASDALSSLGGVPLTSTVNSKALSNNITLNASDVGAVSTSDIITVDRAATNYNSTIPASSYGTLTFELPYPANQMKILGVSRCYSWGNTSSDFKGTQYYITIQGVEFPVVSTTSTTVTLRLYNQSNVPLYSAALVSFPYMLKN